MTTVLACGTFDILHPGHVHYLNECKQLGDFLIVIVGRNTNITKFKGEPPINSEYSRLRMVQSLKAVNLAILGSEGNIYDRIVQLKPDVIALGYDQKPEDKTILTELGKRGFETKIVRMTPHHNEEYKSSKIKHKIIQRHQERENREPSLALA